MLPTGYWKAIYALQRMYNDGLDQANNFVSGMGDAITFGGTKYVRQNFTIDLVNYNSGLYLGGQIAGTVISTVISFGGGVLRVLSGVPARSFQIARAYSNVSNAVGFAQAGNNLYNAAVNGGPFSIWDALAFLPAAGSALGKVGKSLGIWGCFVVDTPVAVGWNYDPIGTVAAAWLKSRQTDGNWNIGWMIAGVGIAATTVYVRTRLEKERDERKKLPALDFARRPVDDLTDDPQDDDRTLPPLARGGQGGSGRHRLSLKKHYRPDVLIQDQPLAAPNATRDNPQQELATSTTSTPRLPSRETPRSPAARRKTAFSKLFWSLPLLLAGLCFWKAIPTAQRPAPSTAAASILPSWP